MRFSENALLDLVKFSESIKMYDFAKKLNPNNPLIYSNKGMRFEVINKDLLYNC